MKMHAREMVPVDSRHEDALTGTYFSSGLHFFRRMICSALGGFCHLYLPRILLMRSGDVETNPGPERTVHEEEFIKLSKFIEPSYYKEVGFHLEIPNAELGQILAQRMLNFSDALMTVFTRWRNKQQRGTDMRALLADRLERSGLGRLSGELLAGSLVPNRPGAPVTPSGSQTEPLSPELIKRCAEDFKLKYRTTLCKIRADPLDPDSLVQFEDMYTNLDLEEEYRKSKRHLKYKDFLNLKVNGEFPRRLVVQGEAGAGKTTFCAKIVWDWINESSVLPLYVWMIIVPLREAEQYSIGEIAKSYLTMENPTTTHQITDYISSNQKKVFIALDGLDEFRGKLVQQKKDGSKSERAQSPSADQMQLPSSPSAGALSQQSISTSEACGGLSKRGEITSILRSDELAACPVLVTSRPWKVSEIRWNVNLRKLYTFINLEGFSKENVAVYIHKYFQDDKAKADQLIRLIRDNDNISRNMAQYPIYIAMLCLMWRELDDQKRDKFESFQTFSQLTEEMFDFLKVHHAQKVITDLGSPEFTGYLKQIEWLMQPIAKHAFTGLQENTLVFKEEDFQHCLESMETACRVGVLSQEKRLTSRRDKSNNYLQSTVFFPHKLFQEYMAGVHFASLYETDYSEFNRLIEEVVLARKEEFRYLLYFTVSRSKSSAHHLMKCLVNDNIEMKKYIDLLVDVAFESQDQDLAAFLRDKVSSAKIEVEINNPTAHTTAGYIFTKIYVYAASLRFLRQECGPTTSHDMAEIICYSSFLRRVALKRVFFHNDFFAVFAKEGKNSKVENLCLEDFKCPTAASSQDLAKALCSMPHLAELRLERMYPKEEFYSTLKMMASISKMKLLRLGDVDCPTPVSSQNIAEALCSMPNLTDLRLNGMDLCEEFCSTLKEKASTLQVRFFRLFAVKCPKPASSQNLAEALCFMPNLTDLTLGEGIRGRPELHEDFYFTLNATASSMQGHFPHISKGDFKFNGALQRNLDYFLHSLGDYQRECPPIWTSQPSGHSQPQTMGDVQPSDHPQQQSVGDVDPLQSNYSQQESMGDVDSLHTLWILFLVLLVPLAISLLKIF